MIELHRKLISAGLPIVGVSTISPDKAAWRIDFAPEATEEQKAQAAQIVASFDAGKVEHNASIDEQIRTLEETSGGYIRGLREFMLAQASETKRLGGADFMGSKGMQNVKALDDQIRALRGQRLP